MAQGDTDCSHDFMSLTMAGDSPDALNFKSQKVNLSSRRLTMPLNYLNRESARTPAKTRTAARKSIAGDLRSSDRPDHLKRVDLRRSARISARKVSKPSGTVRNPIGSKSVFHEIHEKLIELKNIDLKLTHFVEVDVLPWSVNRDFCAKLSQQTSSNPSTYDPIIVIKKKMDESFKILNARLNGQTPKKPAQSHGMYYHSTSENNETEHISFGYFGPSEWVYSTPPRTRAPPRPKLESKIQPALLVKQDDKTVLYELDQYNQFKRRRMSREASPKNDVRPMETLCSGNFLFSGYRMSQYEENTRRPAKSLFKLNECFIDGAIMSNSYSPEFLFKQVS